MVRYVRLNQPRPLVACCPVKLTGIYDDTSDGCPVSADELGCRMDDNISAILDRANQIRSCKGVVHDERDSCFVCDLCDALDINYLRVRVAERLDGDRLCIRLDRSLDSLIVERINKGCGNSVIRKCMCQQVVGSAVDVLCCYDMVSCMCNCLIGIGKCCCTGTNGKCCRAAFECCDSRLEGSLCRVGQTAVDIACISQAETVCCMFTVMENIGGCQIDRNCSCIGNRICCFLSYM